jgi:hypothetical protein
MKTVTVDGTIYTKAKDVADTFGYTSDYLGQLCRANKIDCQLVGRSWYVSIDSVEVHKQSKHPSASVSLSYSEFNTLELSANKDIASAVEVRPVLSKRAIRSTSVASSNRVVQSYQPVRYLPDEQELLPRPSPKISPRIIPMSSHLPDLPPSSLLKEDKDISISNVTTSASKAVNTPVSKTPARKHLKVQSSESFAIPNPTRSTSSRTTTASSLSREKETSTNAVHNSLSIPSVPKPIKSRREVVVTTAPRRSIAHSPVAPSQSQVFKKPSKSTKIAKPTPNITGTHPTITQKATVTPNKVVFSPQSIAQTSSARLSVAYRLVMTVGALLIFGLLVVSYFGVLRVEVDETSSRTSIQLQRHFSL